MNSNTQDECILFAYLNIDHPVVAWEVAIGRIKSVFDERYPNFGISSWQFSLLDKYSKNGYNTKFINELLLEKKRQINHPHKVSRLQGLYFFENEDDAHRALDRWGLSKYRGYISPVRFKPEKITKVDSEWITSYLNSGKSTDWMEDYWRGETLGIRPLTEILALGVGVVLNYDLRIQAYKNIYYSWPDSTPLLAMACCAFQVKNLDDIAIIKPALLRENDKIKGVYCVNIEDLKLKEKEVVEAMDYCKEHGVLPRYKIPENEPDAFFRLLDLRGYCFELINKTASEILEEVHK